MRVWISKDDGGREKKGDVVEGICACCDDIWAKVGPSGRERVFNYRRQQVPKPKQASSRGGKSNSTSNAVTSKLQGMISSLRTSHWFSCESFHFVSCSAPAKPLSITLQTSTCYSTSYLKYCIVNQRESGATDPHLRRQPEASMCRVAMRLGNSCRQQVRPSVKLIVVKGQTLCRHTFNPFSVTRNDSIVAYIEAECHVKYLVRNRAGTELYITTQSHAASTWHAWQLQRVSW